MRAKSSSGFVQWSVHLLDKQRTFGVKQTRIKLVAFVDERNRLDALVQYDLSCKNKGSKFRTKGDGPRVSIRPVVTPSSDRLVDHRHWQLAPRHNRSIIGWYCSEYLSSKQRVRICQPACSIALRFVGTVLLSDRKYEFIADYFTSFLHIRVNLLAITLLDGWSRMRNISLYDFIYYTHYYTILWHIYSCKSF